MTPMPDTAPARTDALLAAFRERFGGEASVVRAPGRVNLIGEHTDYNDGFVLPIAIDRDVRIAFAPRSDRRVRLYSLDFRAASEFELEDIRPDPEATWSNYVRGMAVELLRDGLPLRGMDAVMQGDVPIAAGLSSSAALEVAAGLAFQVSSEIELGPVELAQLAQRAEHEFMGVRVGIMDQFISRIGRGGHALSIDCRTLEYRQVPLNAVAHCFVVADSRQSRELAGSAYNERRAQCEAAVAALAETALATKHPVRALRDVDPVDLGCYGYSLDLTIGRRARHIVWENARVLAAIAHLERGDLEAFGELMDESHESLRFDYEVSSPALDLLAGAARQVEGCLGSRLTGAGFGGCTVSLVRRDQVDAFRAHVAEQYARGTGVEPHIFVTDAADGAGLVAVGRQP